MSVHNLCFIYSTTDFYTDLSEEILDKKKSQFKLCVKETYYYKVI